MRHYETLFIINPDINEVDINLIVEKFSKILSASNASITKVDVWGRRRMAYEVKKFNKGYFVLFDYGTTPEVVLEIEHNLKIDERIIRFLTIKKSNFYDPEAIAKAEAAIRVAQAINDEKKDDVADQDYDGEYEEENEN